MLGTNVHPYLEPYFSLLARCKARAGDTEGAERVRGGCEGRRHFEGAAHRYSHCPLLLPLLPLRLLTTDTGNWHYRYCHCYSY